MNEYISMEDNKFEIDLESLAMINYPSPNFCPLTDLSIIDLIYHGDLISFFSGKYLNENILIETCNRIPYRLACREYKILTEFLNVDSIVKVKCITRNPSLGFVAFGYQWFDFIPKNQEIPFEKLPILFNSLLNTISKLHQKNIIHNWICRSTVHILSKYDSIILSSFHSAFKIGEPSPLTVFHKCHSLNLNHLELKKGDVYSCAKWYLSFYNFKSIDEIEIPLKIKNLLKKMLNSNIDERCTIDQALEKLNKFLGKEIF